MLDLVITCTDAAVSGDGTVSITVDQPASLVAPAQVWLTATGHTDLAAFEKSGDTYEGEFHEYYHEWTINGEPLPDWDKPVNLVAEHNNPNKAFGKEVAFCLSEPGDYVIDLVVTDKDGKQAFASTSTMTVQDPEDFFSDAERVYVDLSGVHAGVPAGSTKVSTLEAMNTAVIETDDNSNVWVRFKRGDVYDFSDVAPGHVNQNFRGSLKLSANTDCILFSDWGAPEDARPKFTPSTIPFHSGGSLFDLWETGFGQVFFAATGLDFESGYDSSIERGDLGTGLGGAFGLINGPGPSVLFHDINVGGLSKGFYTDSGNGTNPNQRVMVAGCHIYDYYDYGILGGQTYQRLAYIGNRIGRSVDAPRGYGTAFQNYHGPIRIPASKMAYISGNDLFTNSGRNEGGHQPCLRLCVSTYAGDHAYVERNSMEGGYEVIQIMKKAGGAGSLDANPMNCVVERNILSKTSNSSTIITMERSGVTIRDNLFVNQDFTRENSGTSNNDAILMLTPDYGPWEEFNPSDPITIYNNTYVNFVSPSNQGTSTYNFTRNNAGYFTNLTVENNVVHMPNMTVPDVAFAPIDTTTLIPGYALRYKGLKRNFIVSEGYDIPTEVLDDGVLLYPYASVTLDLQNNGTGAGATNQAYWQAIEGTDTRHQLLPNNGDRLFSLRGHFEINFDDATYMTITNRSGYTWEAGHLQFYPDRTSLIEAANAAYANAPDVPLPRPLTGSSAIGAATAGRVSPKDFLLASRGATPSKGALEPV